MPGEAEGEHLGKAEAYEDTTVCDSSTDEESEVSHGDSTEDRVSSKNDVARNLGLRKRRKRGEQMLGTGESDGSSSPEQNAQDIGEEQDDFGDGEALDSGNGEAWSSSSRQSLHGGVEDEKIISDISEISEICDPDCDDMVTSEAAEEKPQRREVYKMPGGSTSNPKSVIFWPANLVVMAVAWQIRLLFNMCGTAVSVLAFMFELAMDPVQKTNSFKQQFSSQIKPMATDLGPKVSSFARRFAWGVLGVTYVLIVLSILLVPVIFVEYFYVTRYIEKPLDIKAPLYFNYAEAHPSSTFSLAPFLDEVGSGHDDLAATKPFSWYKLQVSVTLALPESDYNQQLGMFQVAAELLSPKNGVLQRSSRPCMLRFQSLPVRYAKTLLYSVPLLLDFSGEYQIIQLDLLEVSNTQHISEIPIGGVKIVLEPRAGFPAGSGLPEIYAAELRLRTQLSWKMSLLFKWKRTIYVWSATFLFIGEVAVVLCCFRQVLIPKKKSYRALSKIKQEPLAVRKPRSHTKKRVSFQE